MKKLNTFEEMIGKTVKSVKVTGFPPPEDDYDDRPYLHIFFTDGTKIIVYASYGSFTGKSMDEYPARINVAG